MESAGRSSRSHPFFVLLHPFFALFFFCGLVRLQVNTDATGLTSNMTKRVEAITLFILELRAEGFNESREEFDERRFEL